MQSESHEGKRFPCTEKHCNSRLSSRRKLIQHLQKVHSGEPKKTKVVKTGKDRANRSDKGTFKTSMASMLSIVDKQPVKQDALITEPQNFKQLENRDEKPRGKYEI